MIVVKCLLDLGYLKRERTTLNVQWMIYFATTVHVNALFFIEMTITLRLHVKGINLPFITFYKFSMTND